MLRTSGRNSIKTLVVYDGKTRKIYPHVLGIHGDVLVDRIHYPDPDSLIVSMIRLDHIDTLNWYVLSDADAERSKL